MAVWVHRLFRALSKDTSIYAAQQGFPLQIERLVVDYFRK